MTRSSHNNPLTHLFGATLLLFGITAVPAQATTLTGFATEGDMMQGMRVTASFLNGTSESLLWTATGDNSGGVLGTGWSLTQAGNTYGSPWTFSNTGLGISSLAIDAVPGNTVFDTYPFLDGPLQTDGSAEGWSFQVTGGPGPNSFAYADPIDISRGDLFGTLSLYWTTGFAGTMQFIADTDSGSGSDPVQPADPIVRVTPPTVSIATPTIYEGNGASAALYAIDPGEDAITFFLNGGNVGTDFQRSGLRSVSSNLGVFADNGVHTYTAKARDEDGNWSTPSASTLTVLNVAPTLTAFDLSSTTINEGQSASAQLYATDPGADGQTFFINGNAVGADGRTAGTRTVGTSLGTFADEGTFTFTSRAQDKDAAWSNPLTRTLTVLNVAPTITQLTQDLTVMTDEWFDFTAAATDPGIQDILSFDWDFNMDGIFDDFTGTSGQWSFADAGTYEVGLRVSDGDGGFAYGSFLVDAVAQVADPEPEPEDDPTPESESIPEPGSVLGLLVLGAFGVGAWLKRDR
jgi:hypothetical protein